MQWNFNHGFDRILADIQANALATNSPIIGYHVVKQSFRAQNSKRVLLLPRCRLHKCQPLLRQALRFSFDKFPPSLSLYRNRITLLSLASFMLYSSGSESRAKIDFGSSYDELPIAAPGNAVKRSCHRRYQIT